MIFYLNILAYQALGLQQFADSFPDYDESEKVFTHDKNIRIMAETDKIQGSMKDNIIHGSQVKEKLIINNFDTNEHPIIDRRNDKIIGGIFDD